MYRMSLLFRRATATVNTRCLSHKVPGLASSPALGFRTLSTSSAGPSRVLALPDGRNLEFHEYGDPKGVPVIYIHGAPDSGVTLSGFPDALGKKLGVRWIAPDRPGIGLSSFYTNRKVLDYPADVESLIRHLNLGNYRILGTSGGTGYTLACAKALPKDKLRAVGICAGIGPWEAGLDGQSQLMRDVMIAWKEHPKAMAELLDVHYVSAAQDPDPAKLEAWWKEALMTSFSEDDRKILLEDDALKSALKVLRRVFMNGSAAHAEEFRLLTKSWGFQVEDVGYEGIMLWYGGLDGNTPPSMGRYMAERLPGAVYKEYPDKSHYSIWTEDMVTGMLKELLE